MRGGWIGVDLDGTLAEYQGYYAGAIGAPIRPMLVRVQEWLAAGGTFIAKVFEGPDVHPFVQSLRGHFAKVTMFKPKSSRSESKEIFILGLGFVAAAPVPA